MFLTECCEGRTRVGCALLGSEDIEIMFLMLALMVYVQDFMLHLKCAAYFRCSCIF